MLLRVISFWWVLGSLLVRVLLFELFIDVMFFLGVVMFIYGLGMLNFDGCLVDVSDVIDNM